MNELTNELAKLEKDLLNNLELSKAKNTLKAYKSDFEDFRKFCISYNLSYMPSNPKIVGLYISKISKNLKYSTLKRRIASIKVVHKIKGHYIDCRHPLIRENIIGIRRSIGSYQKSKKALLYNDLINIIEYLNKLLVNKNYMHVRDKSIILIGFSGGFRRSELSSLDLEDLEFVKEGVKINIKQSKSDQFGIGHIKAIPYAKNQAYCPVIALKDWINVKKCKKKTLFECSEKMVALIVKKYVAAVGLNPDLYSGHSLRSGFATSTAEKGADERSIMSMTGHKSAEMVRRYIKEGNLFKNNALNHL